MTDGDPAIPLWPDNPSGDDLLGFADIADPILEAVRREKLDPVAVGVFWRLGLGESSVLEILAGRLRDRGMPSSSLRARGSTTRRWTRRRP